MPKQSCVFLDLSWNLNAMNPKLQSTINAFNKKGHVNKAFTNAQRRPHIDPSLSGWFLSAKRTASKTALNNLETRFSNWRE